MELKFLFKKVYGKQLYYPLNGAAKVMVWLKGSKTLVDSDLVMLKNAGFKCTLETEGPSVAKSPQSLSE